jgi:hypothetical protein
MRSWLSILLVLVAQPTFAQTENVATDNGLWSLCGGGPANTRVACIAYVRGLHDMAAYWIAEPTAELRARAVKSRDLIAARMTREQIAEAQKLAAEWRPKPEP